MTPNRRITPVWLVFFGLAAPGFLFSSLAASAQGIEDSGYTGIQADQNAAQAPATGAGQEDPNADQTGPVRLARFTYVSGNVTWRTDSSSEWSPAVVNVPLRQGAEISVAGVGRAELQFDDGSLVRFGNGATAALKTLYSDQDGEFTEIDQTAGISTLRLIQPTAIFQINTPFASVKANGPARVRIGVDSGVEVADHLGTATVEGQQNKITLQAGDYLDLPTANSDYAVRALPGADSWEQWNDERDAELDQQQNGQTPQHVPADVAIVAGNLDSYGTWDEDPSYGWVWTPRITDPVWRPYYAGHWVWVNPFGWTWVADEPWGWAPYHYGTWAHLRHGWAWVPGPASQYWCPAVVNFSELNGVVCWAPLCPEEVRYPRPFSIGYRHGDWESHFSIGRAGCYYPASAGVFTVSVWSNSYVNRVTFAGGAAGVGRGAFAPNRNTYVSGPAYVPVNARTAAGATFSPVAQFGGNGRYQPVRSGDTSYFTGGHSIGAPPAGSRPAAGPITVQPTLRATTPTRTFTPQSSAPVAARSVYRAPVSLQVARGSAPITPSGTTARQPVISGTGRPTTSPPVSRGVPPPGATDRIPTTVGSVGTGRSAAAEAARQARESLGLPSRSTTSGQTGNTSPQPGGRSGADNYHPTTVPGGNTGNPNLGPGTRGGNPGNPNLGPEPRGGNPGNPNVGPGTRGGNPGNPTIGPGSRGTGNQGSPVSPGRTVSPPPSGGQERPTRTTETFHYREPPTSGGSSGGSGGGQRGGGNSGGGSSGGSGGGSRGGGNSGGGSGGGSKDSGGGGKDSGGHGK